MKSISKYSIAAILIYFLGTASCGDKNITNPTDNQGKSKTAKIAFLSNRENDTYKLFVMSLDGSNQTKIADKADWSLTPKWSKDGRTIFFANKNLYSIDSDGQNLKPLFEASNLRKIYVRPQGDKLLCANQSGSWHWYLVNSDGSGSTYLFSGYNDLVLSPDGNSIYMSSRDKVTIRSLNWEIESEFSLPIASSNVGEDGVSFSISPDNSKFCYSYLNTLRIIGTDGKSHKILASIYDPIPGYDLLASTYENFSSNSQYIVYTKTLVHDNQLAIYSIKNDGTQNTRLTNEASRYLDPVFSKEGDKIYFSSNLAGNYEIYVMNRDGSNITNLTKSPFNDGNSDYGSFSIWEP